MLTKAVDYAIRMLIYMAKGEKGKLFTRKEISEKCKIPTLFLAKIAQNLSQKRIISIAKGAKGGYILNRGPEDITLLEIIEIFSGEIYLNHCIKHKELCEFSSKCYVHKIWEEITEKLREMLNSVTLKELAEKDTCFNS